MQFNDKHYGDYLNVSKRTKSSRLHIVAVPELNDDGDYSPCAYIRLLLPLDYMKCIGIIDLTITSAERVSDYAADVIFCQRTSSCSKSQALALLSHARRSRTPIFYDLDDNLLEIDSTHPEIEKLKAKEEIIRIFLSAADAVFFSTDRLRADISTRTEKTFVQKNTLDQRIIADRQRVNEGNNRLGILYMGTNTHHSDFGLVSWALSRIVREFGATVKVGILGVTQSTNLPSGIERVSSPPSVGTSYPAFMSWLTGVAEWNIGISPLRDSKFNSAKSPIKALDYMAMGALSIVSNGAAYESLPSDVVVKVDQDPTKWFEAIASAVEDCERRVLMTQRGIDLLNNSFTLETSLSNRIDLLRTALTN